MPSLTTTLALCLTFMSLNTFAHEQLDTHSDDAEHFHVPDWYENLMIDPINIDSCRKPTAAQREQVDAGNLLVQDFLNRCAQATNGSPWCEQLTRPNPDSRSTFYCTYGNTQVHQLIHPDRSTWTNAFQAVNLVEELEDLDIKTCIIYNWWRPEPYNANVGGAPGRHPYGTSVDVRFCSKAEMEQAFLKLCQWRAEGRLRAIGYYGSTALHMGIGDQTANTWGKRCPN